MIDGNKDFQWPCASWVWALKGQAISASSLGTPKESCPSQGETLASLCLFRIWQLTLITAFALSFNYAQLWAICNNGPVTAKGELIGRLIVDTGGICSCTFCIWPTMSLASLQHTHSKLARVSSLKIGNEAEYLEYHVVSVPKHLTWGNRNISRGSRRLWGVKTEDFISLNLHSCRCSETSLEGWLIPPPNYWAIQTLL